MLLLSPSSRPPLVLLSSPSRPPLVLLSPSTRSRLVLSRLPVVLSRPPPVLLSSSSRPPPVLSSSCRPPLVLLSSSSCPPTYLEPALADISTPGFIGLPPWSARTSIFPCMKHVSSFVPGSCFLPMVYAIDWPEAGGRPRVLCKTIGWEAVGDRACCAKL